MYFVLLFQTVLNKKHVFRNMVLCNQLEHVYQSLLHKFKKDLSKWVFAYHTKKQKTLPFHVQSLSYFIHFPHNRFKYIYRLRRIT